MRFKYRWTYVVIVSFGILVISYMYDFRSLLILFADLQMQEMHLSRQLAVSKQAQLNEKNKVRDAVSHHFATSVMSDLFLLLHLHGLRLVTTELNQEDVLHLVMQGELDQVSTLVFELYRRFPAMILLDFSCKSGGEREMLFTATLTLIDYDIPLMRMQNPNKLDVLTQQADPPVPICQMKMTGALQQGNRRQALIALPNNNVMAVEKGYVLGKEHALVMEIAHDHVVVNVHGKRLLIAM